MGGSIYVKVFSIRADFCSQYQHTGSIVMKKKILQFVTFYLLLSVYSCNNLTEPTYEDSFKSKDPTSTHDILTGKFIFCRTTWDREGFASSAITLLDLKDYSQKGLKGYSSSRVSHLALSNDSNILIYNREENYTNAEYFIKIDITAPNTSEVVLSTTDSANFPRYATWTHDNKLAYLRRESGSWKLMIEGKNIDVDRNIEGEKIVFTKDGKEMIYSSLDDSFHISLYSYDLNTHSSRVLVQANSSEQILRIYFPSISADDARIVFVKSYNGNHSDELWVVNRDGSNLKKLLTLDGSLLESRPVWSPDGKKIAFISFHQIYVMNDDGTNRKKLTSSTADEILWFK